ncbi:hypothetical protein ASR50_31485 [Streptomyces sp. 4F]|nr:hypothetical protein ASR50_31485 [Streptomyces sp. 4F]
MDTPALFPTDRCCPQVVAGLGGDRTADWLCGAREVDEPAVRPAAHGTGLTSRLLDAVTADVGGHRAATAAPKLPGEPSANAMLLQLVCNKFRTSHSAPQ